MWHSSIQQREIPPDLIGPLREYDGDLLDQQGLAATVADNGYLLLRDVLDRDQVLSARGEVMQRLADVGEIRVPAIEGIATGVSGRDEQQLGTFWAEVSNGPVLRQATHGSRIVELISTLLGQPARPHDLVYLRPMAPGPGTRLHYDFPFFAGFSDQIHTAWIPLGDVPVEDGGLVVMEKSNQFDDLIDPIRQLDYQQARDNETIQAAAYEKQNDQHPVDMAKDRGTRLLTTDFRAGDLLVFNMFLLHGSLDNLSPQGRVRLSCDVRYQPAADPYDDPRYFGAQPSGSKGGGYGDMRGAQPLA
jgi:ectoine hydroxylase-related dioxygenase (phytanoyl-CoA dioxygenase family)